MRTKGSDIESRLKELLAKKRTNVIIAKVQSQTKKDKQYEIRLTVGGQVYCTCPGWQHSKDKNCKHVDMLRAALSDGRNVMVIK
jgi:hypothetical protein